MASFDEHIEQANKNLSFLSSINKSQIYWDWQVTVSFYAAVHFVNAHLAKVANLHYRTHEDVKNALNPYNTTSLCKIPEEIYLSYAKLELLSRRSRYLCHDSKKNDNEYAQFTYDKHFAKAIRHLDVIINYFKDKYGFSCNAQTIKCSELSNRENLNFFEV